MFRNSHENSAKDFTFYPLCWLAGAFASGILTANFLAFDWKISLVAGLFFAVSSAFLLKNKIAASLICLAFFALGALVWQIENRPLPGNRIKKIYDDNRLESNSPVEIEGVLRGEPELAVGGMFLVVSAEKLGFKSETQQVKGQIKLFAPIADQNNAEDYARLDLRNGSQIRVACRLQRENNYQNPGVILSKELLDQQEIDASGMIKSALLVEKIGEKETFAPIGWIYRTRQNLIGRFQRTFSVSTAGVLIASLLGDKYFLDKPTAEIFREDGTFHVLVISGLHITFIGGLVLLLTGFLTRRKTWRFLITVMFLWAFTLAVGADVPVVRAALMLTILLFSQIVNRRGTLLNAFGACALILLVWRPDDIFTASFQLTFASVGAIVTAAFPLIENLRKIGSWSPNAEEPFPPNVSPPVKRFCETLYWRENIWEIENKRQIWSAKIFKSPAKLVLKTINLQKISAYLFEAVIVSLIAQICLLPLSVVYFHRLSFAAVLFNLYVEVVIALETFTALAAVLLASVSETLALPLIKLTELFNYLLIAFPGFFVTNNWASFRLPAYSGSHKFVYAVYFAPVLPLIFLLNKWQPFALVSQIDGKIRRTLKICALAVVLLIAVTVFHPFSTSTPDGKMHIDFIDVGQGDAALLTFPNGETMLVDGGGKMNFDRKFVKNETDDEPELFVPDSQTIGESVVSPFLWSKGLDKIDYLLATHADTDHIQGLTAVAKNFHIRAAFFGRTPFADEDFAELDDVLQKRKIASAVLKRGDVLDFGGATVEILYPQADDSAQAIADNNHCLVLRVVYGNKKFLLTGDIEKEAEKALLQTPQLLQADFVKVAHHGSRTSSTENFIAATKAEYAIISVGRRSRFGHPHAEVVERWQNSGAKIYKTGESGTISVSTDGKNLEIQTFLH